MYQIKLCWEAHKTWKQTIKITIEYVADPINYEYLFVYYAKFAWIPALGQSDWTNSRMYIWRLGPPPPCHCHTHATYQYCRLLLGDPPPCADIVCTCPLSSGFRPNFICFIHQIKYIVMAMLCDSCSGRPASGNPDLASVAWNRCNFNEIGRGKRKVTYRRRD